MSSRQRRLGYLSAAPRVSLKPDAQAMAPRTHMQGVIGAFEALGWSVHPFVIGDRMPERVRTGSEETLTAARWRTLAADLLRLGMGPVVSRQAWRELGTAVDVVYERLGAFQTLGGFFQRHGVPWILESNSLHFAESLSDRKSATLRRVLSRREIAAYRECDRVVCVSDALKGLIVDAAAIDRDKVVVMPNAVDTRRFDPSCATPVRLFSGPTIGFVGYLIAWQGLDLLLDAVSELSRRGIDVCAVIVGDGPERGRLQDQSRSLGIADRVRLVGRVAVDRVPDYIAGFDLGYSGQVPLSAGAMYNSPLKLYEYMAMAKPVVASAYPDARSLVEGKETGFLFTPSDRKDLADVLGGAVERRDLLPAMGRNARLLVEQHHSWTARVRRLMPVIDGLVGHE